MGRFNCGNRHTLSTRDPTTQCIITDMNSVSNNVMRKPNRLCDRLVTLGLTVPAIHLCTLWCYSICDSAKNQTIYLIKHSRSSPKNVKRADPVTQSHTYLGSNPTFWFLRLTAWKIRTKKAWF